MIMSFHINVRTVERDLRIRPDYGNTSQIVQTRKQTNMKLPSLPYIANRISNTI
jgi:hypothetical protein